jgi:hypothetical protein
MSDGSEVSSLSDQVAISYGADDDHIPQGQGIPALLFDDSFTVLRGSNHDQSSSIIQREDQGGERKGVLEKKADKHTSTDDHESSSTLYNPLVEDTHQLSFVNFEEE